MRVASLTAVMLVIAVAGCTHTIRSKSEWERVYGCHVFETIDAWYYTGSSGGYHYFRNAHTMGTDRYRVPREAFLLKRTFTPMKDRGQWVRLPLGVFLPTHNVDRGFILASGKWDSNERD